DTGGGYRDLPFRHIGETGVLDTGPVSFTGDLAVRALGWQRSAGPLWRIAQSAPLPCTILSVATEIKVND
ncbi:MAG: hypothetical protein RLT05_34620, partial [Bauldia litoralis]